MELQNWGFLFAIVGNSTLQFWVLLLYKKHFYGIGKTNYMLFQSLIINTFFYGILFFLYKIGIYKPTLNLIAVMFAAGIGFDALLTFGIFRWMLKRKNLKIEY